MENLDALKLSDELEDELSSMYDELFGTDADIDLDSSDDSDLESDENIEAGAGVEPAGEETETIDYPEGDADADEVETPTDETETDEPVEVEVAADGGSDDSGDGDAAVEDAPQLYTVKVNGEEREVELDELVRGYQTMRAANEKFEAAAEKEKALQQYVEFGKSFAQALEEDPAALFAEYVEVVPDPNTVIVKMIERAAVKGKLHPDIADALGISETDTLRARADYERSRAERLQQAQSQVAAEQPDEFGYVPSQYSQIVNEIVAAAGMADAEFETKRQFVSELAAFRTERKIANPYLAYAEWQKVRAAEAAATAAAAAAATKQAAKPKRAPSPSSSGQVTPPKPTTQAPIHDHYEAAARAFEELLGE